MKTENKRPVFFEEEIEKQMKQDKIKHDRLKELISVLSYLSSERSDYYRCNALYRKHSYNYFMKAISTKYIKNKDKLKEIFLNNKEWIYDYAMNNKREPIALNETVNCLINIIGNDSRNNIIGTYILRKEVNISVELNCPIVLGDDISYKNLSNKLLFKV